MRFCKSEDNGNPIIEFLDAIAAEDAQKVLWVLKLTDEVDWVPAQYISKMEDGKLWEVRIPIGSKNYWILAFKDDDEWVLCNADFSTDKQFALEDEMEQAQQTAKNYKAPLKLIGQNDLSKYIKKRKKKNSTFAADFDEGYMYFKLGAILRQVRQKAGLTQAEIADKLEISSSTVSRIENHADKLDISALEDYVKNWSEKLKEELVK